MRVWVAGCATGEEVYSVAIVLDEARAAAQSNARIRLFATDIHQDALKQASAGVYPREALEGFSAQRRQRYFIEEGSSARVADFVREMVVFATHNLVSDAPFTQLDMICCRNVLIYLQPATQARVVALFHFGLRTGGLLFLGPSETLGKIEDEFQVISSTAKRYAHCRSPWGLGTTARRSKTGWLAAEYVESLERDLELARAQLQSTVEELEAANEELQAANEELVASNEELQSTNEELRSVNEELSTVNVDHQNKIVQLTEVTEDLEKLLHTINVGVLFLDPNMCIRRANQRMAELLHILPQDVGRSFEHFKNNLDAPGVFQSAQTVLHDGEPVEREIRTQDGQVLHHQQVHGWDHSLLECRRRETLRLHGAGSHRTTHRIDRARRPSRGMVAEVRKGHDVPPFETVRRHKSGAHLHVLVSVAPIRSEAGKLTGVSSISLDITDRKLAEQRAQVAVEQRDKFLAMLSHELRNPLMALSSANELLMQNNTGDDVSRRAQKLIARQITQMSRLLEDTLDASRMRHDKIELDRRRLDFRGVVEAAADSARARSEEHGVKLELSLPDGPLFVKADPTRLQQVIVNLLQNAINHSERGQVIKMALANDNGGAVVQVEDEGAGIPPEALPKIFEPFFQASRRSRHGMGLGLSLARSIVRAHGGDIRAASEGRGKGASFEIQLPLEGNGAETAADLQGQPDFGASDQITVLLVDDDDASRESIGALLRRAGYNVLEADNGTKGLRHRADQPERGGHRHRTPGHQRSGACRRVRSNGQARAIRLIALTGFGRQADREAAIEAGCDMRLGTRVGPHTATTTR